MTMSKFKLRHIDAIGLRAPDAEGECRIKNMIYVCVIYCPTQRYTITQQLGKKKKTSDRGDVSKKHFRRNEYNFFTT